MMLSCGFGDCFELRLRILTVAGASGYPQMIVPSELFEYCTLDQLQRDYVFENVWLGHRLVCSRSLDSGYHRSKCWSETCR